MDTNWKVAGCNKIQRNHPDTKVPDADHKCSQPVILLHKKGHSMKFEINTSLMYKETNAIISELGSNVIRGFEDYPDEIVALLTQLIIGQEKRRMAKKPMFLTYRTPQYGLRVHEVDDRTTELACPACEAGLPVKEWGGAINS